MPRRSRRAAFLLRARARGAEAAARTDSRADLERDIAALYAQLADPEVLVTSHLFQR